MARANENKGHGWDFVKVGETYQYKEDGWIADVKILEDNSTDDEYRFKLQTIQSRYEPPTDDGIFSISHIKNLDGIYTGMIQLYESPEYAYTPRWKSEPK